MQAATAQDTTSEAYSEGEDDNRSDIAMLSASNSDCGYGSELDDSSSHEHATRSTTRSTTRVPSPQPTSRDSSPWPSDVFEDDYTPVDTDSLESFSRNKRRINRSRLLEALRMLESIPNPSRLPAYLPSMPRSVNDNDDDAREVFSNGDELAGDTPFEQSESPEPELEDEPQVQDYVDDAKEAEGPETNLESDEESSGEDSGSEIAALPLRPACVRYGPGVDGKWGVTVEGNLDDIDPRSYLHGLAEKLLAETQVVTNPRRF